MSSIGFATAALFACNNVSNNVEIRLYPCALTSTPTSVQLDIQSYDQKNAVIGKPLTKKFPITEPTVFSDGYATVGFRPPTNTKTADFTVTWLYEQESVMAVYTKIPVPRPGQTLTLGDDKCISAEGSSTTDLGTSTDITSDNNSTTGDSSSTSSDTTSDVTSTTDATTSTTDPDTTDTTTGQILDHGLCGWNNVLNYYACPDDGGVPSVENENHSIDCMPGVVEDGFCTKEEGPVTNYGCCMENGDLFYCDEVNNKIIKIACGEGP